MITFYGYFVKIELIYFIHLTRSKGMGILIGRIFFSMCHGIGHPESELFKQMNPQSDTYR